MHRNSARSHLPAALWRPYRARGIGRNPPAIAIAAGSIAAAGRHHLPLRRLRPRHIDEVQQDGDLVVTVCDLAHEELGQRPAVLWSVPDRSRPGTPAAFDAALADLRHRIERFAPCLAAAP
jgi:ArsR family transcriptional regulator, arsenate/arsenite/antimonite-responsive transcriptional repressor / arsenate reductase (thioredoxin)